MVHLAQEVRLPDTRVAPPAESAPRVERGERLFDEDIVRLTQLRLAGFEVEENSW